MMCPGLKKQNMRRFRGDGSQTDSSHTSVFLFGCALESAESEPKEARYLMGEVFISDCDLTRCAFGVAGFTSTLAPCNRYFRL